MAHLILKLATVPPIPKITHAMSEKTGYYQSEEIQEHLPLHIKVTKSKRQTPIGSKRGVSRGLSLYRNVVVYMSNQSKKRFIERLLNSAT